MNVSQMSRKETGALGEKIAAHYLRRRGFDIVDMNVSRKTGEIDLIAREGDTLHFVEVKSILCDRFPSADELGEDYDPSVNLHEMKIRKVARTAEWYVANKDWEGDWQVDGCLVWIQRTDGMTHVLYLPQIV
jgi:putative endonuclease